MDRNTTIGLVIIFAIFVGFMWWSAPSAEEKAARQRTQDSLVLANQKAAEETQRLEKESQKDLTVEDLNSQNDSLRQAAKVALQKEYGLFSDALQGTAEQISVENEVLKLNFSSLGGKLYSASLKDYTNYQKTPLNLIDSGKMNMGIIFLTAGNQRINSEKLFFKIFVNNEEAEANAKYTVKGQDSLLISLRAYANAGDSGNVGIDESKYLEFSYVVKGEDYDLGFGIQFKNLQAELTQEVKFFDLNFGNTLQRQEKTHKNERMASSVYYKTTVEHVENMSDGKDGEESVKVPLKWISFKQQFFSTTLIADDKFENSELHIATKTDTDPAYLCDMSAQIGVPYHVEKDYNVGMKLYLGPNKYKILKKYDLELERQIPLGWGFFLLQWVNRFVVIPVFNFFEQFNWSYGIIILVLTLLVKIVLFPIAAKSYISSAKMRILQPRVKALSEKYPKKEQAMEKQKATMALYKKAGANPMSGCIPMLLQFPILIALFRFFPASIELRQQPFLWAEDLSTFDSILSLPFAIPFYGNHVSLFCLLMAGINVLYTMMNMKNQTNTGMPGMKMMMYLMPIMLLFMFNSFSAGLNYYYFISTCITILQMLIIQKFVSEEKLEARIKANSQKPVKKSKFMERLEQMQKQQEQMAKNRQKIKK